MLREQMISLLQTSVVFLVLTNAATLAAAVYAMRAAARETAHRQSQSAIERNLQALLRRAR
jgi:hypothetical protein